MKERKRLLRTTGEQALVNSDGWRAYQAYIELERLEPEEPLWPKRAAEAARKAGRAQDAALAFRRAAAAYKRIGFGPQAEIMLRLAAQLETTHS